MIINSIKINGCLSTESLKKISEKNLDFADIIYNLEVEKDIKFIYEINLHINKIKIDKIALSDTILYIILANINIDIFYSNNLGEGCFIKKTLPVVLKSQKLQSIDNVAILTINLELNENSLSFFFCLGIIGENNVILTNEINKKDSTTKKTSINSYDSTLDFL